MPHASDCLPGRTYPLSAVQKEIWTAVALEPAFSSYTIVQSIALSAATDLARLEASIAHAVAETDCLHVHFVESDRGPEQILDTPPPSGLDVRRNMALVEPQIDDAVVDLIQGLMPPSGSPLFRFFCLAMADGSWLYVQAFHHLVMDGYSCALFAQRVARHYSEDVTSYSSEHDARDGYVALLAEEEIYRKSEQARRDRDYWRGKLSECATQVRKSPARTDAAHILQTEIVPLSDAKSWRSRMKALGASLPHLFVAAAALLDSLTKRRHDVVVGFATSARPDDVLRDVAGSLANILPVRLDIDLNSSWMELLKRVTATIREASPHRRARVEDMRRDVGCSSRTGIMMPILINYIPFYGELRFDRHTTRLRGRRYAPIEDFGLFAYFTDDGSDLVLDFVANARQRGESELTRFRGRMCRLCREIVSNLDGRIGDFWLLQPELRHDAHARSLGPSVAPSVETIPEAFARLVSLKPTAPALRINGESVSYGELDRRSDLLARRLVAHGAGPEQIIAVCMERSDDLVMSLVAILKSGAGYLALDPNNPPGRLASTIDDADVCAVIVRRSRVTAFHTDGNLSVPIIDLDEGPALAALAELTTSAHPRSPPVHPGNVAYVCYTSGSSGFPKGVVVSHQNVIDLVRDSRWTADHSSSVLMHSPCSFDASTFEIWLPLLSGGTIVIAPPGQLDATALSRLIASERLTCLWLTAALFHLVADTDPRAFAGLRHLIAGGDVLEAEAVRAVLQINPALQVTNGYGPTEVTTFVSTFAMTDPSTLGGYVPIGWPLDNTRVYILDDRLRLVPSDVVGEIYVAGAGLGRGYLEQPALTSERFVATPFGSAGERMYRTGDLAWRDESGALCFAGRADGQIKLRGFRIEPGEIEAALARLGFVHSAVVVLDQGRPNARLVAYIVSTRVDTNALRGALGDLLPSYMIPSAIVCLDALPLTTHGKIDRGRLPAPEPLRAKRGPRTRLQDILSGFFSKALDLQDIGLDDNFFDDLGGNSLLAIRIAAWVRRELGVNVSPQIMFTAPTIRTLSSAIDDARTGGRSFSEADREAPCLSAEEAGLKAEQIQSILHERFHDQGNDAKAFVATLEGMDRHTVLYSPGAMDERAAEATAFPLGSISKFLTSLLLCCMENSGRLSVHDELDTRLPDDWRVPSALLRSISLADLATHTSGLPAFVPELEACTEDGLRRYLEAFRGDVSDRAYRYCTFGIALLGQALRKREDGTYLDVFRRYVAAPLHLTRTSFRSEICSADHPSFRFYACSREMESSIADLSKIAAALLSRDAGPLAAVLTRMVSVARPTGMPSLDMTLGLRSRRSHGAHLLYHGGGGPGYRAFFGLAPDLNRAIVVLTNREIHIGDIGQHWLSPSYPLAAASAARRRVAHA